MRMDYLEERIKFLTLQLENARVENCSLKQSLLLEKKDSKLTHKKPKSALNRAKDETLERFQYNSPLEIFPEEVWEVLFNYLTSPQDLINCFNVCSLWRNVLKHQRATFLFQEAIPFLYKYLDKQDLLNSRKVCRSWKVGVDPILWNHKDHTTTTLKDFQDGKSKVYSFKTHFSSSEMMENFLEFYSSPHTNNNSNNPFISREVHFQLKPATLEWMTVNEFWNNVHRVLERFGSEIWYCRLALDGPANVYAKLHESLELLPNLKTLWISLGGPMVFLEPVAFIEYMNEHPLPVLSHLEKLQAVNMPNVLVNKILGTHSHLKKLEISAGARDDHFNFNYLYNTSLDKLVDFHTTDDDLVRFSNVQWPLQSLTLKFVRRDFDFAELLHVVNGFASTLRHLNLHLDYPTEDALDPGNIWVTLPHLESLSVKILAPGEHFNSIDFLLPLITLKELTLIYSFAGNNCTENEEEIMKFSGYWDRMYESNIWKLLPNLRKLIIRYPSTSGFIRIENRVQFKEHFYSRIGYQKSKDSSLG